MIRSTTPICLQIRQNSPSLETHKIITLLYTQTLLDYGKDIKMFKAVSFQKKNLILIYFFNKNNVLNEILKRALSRNEI